MSSDDETDSKPITILLLIYYYNNCIKQEGMLLCILHTAEERPSPVLAGQRIGNAQLLSHFACHKTYERNARIAMPPFHDPWPPLASPVLHDPLPPIV